ncbi:MAG: hypothetical protein R3E14_09335 [Erythrobacter sp.]
MKFFRYGEEEFFIKVFATIEDAILWKLLGHITPAPHFIMSRSKAQELIDKVELLREKREVLSKIFQARENKLAFELDRELEACDRKQSFGQSW